MFIAAIIVIAFLILCYFAFFTGKPDQNRDLLEDIPDPDAIEASVGVKDVSPNMSSKTRSLLYEVTFDCADGVSREFFVSEAVYTALNVGDKNTLIYLGKRFMGFGELGASEADGEYDVNYDAFTYEDYDESIDVEQIPETDCRAMLSGEDRSDYEVFLACEGLSPKTDVIEAETASLEKFSAAVLVSKTTIYPFLKHEPDIGKLFARAYAEALTDMRGYEGDSRKGVAADSIFINKNEFRVLIRLNESPKPLNSRIYAEFGVNE